MRPVKTRHFLQLVLLSALWGASFLFIRIASPVLGPNVMAALRIGLATLTLMGIMRVANEPWPWRHWRELFGLGTLTVALPFLLYAWAALHLPAGYSSLLNTMAVPFGVIAAAWMKEDTLSTRKWLGCVCGFAGVALIVQLGPVEPTPALLMAAAACVAASACYGRWASLSTATDRMPARRYRICYWSPATTASPAPAATRCAAITTCRGRAISAA